MATQRHVDVLIVGAGVAGLLLARELRQRGRSVAIAHDPDGQAASDAAVGLLNPVRGRRCTLAWRAAEAFAAARETYGALAGLRQDRPLLRAMPVVRAFTSAEEREAFERKRETIENAGWLVRDRAEPPCGFRPTPHGAVDISGGGALPARELLAGLRAEARSAGCLIEHRCAIESLRFGGDAISWMHGNIAAGQIVLSGGAADRDTQTLRPVAGEALLVRIPDLSDDEAYVCGHHLAPHGSGRFSCGGTKRPGQAEAHCTAAGRTELEQFLAEHLAVSWSVEEHWCGVRASTLDTRPLAGPAGIDPRAWVFNGFGSQGLSHGPWLARLMAEHLINGAPLPPEVDPRRFRRPEPASRGTRWHAVDIAHALVERHLAPGDVAIDLTAGTGGDAVHLARTVGPDGAVLACDIQPAAIEATRRRLAQAACDASVELHCIDHACLRSVMPAGWHGRVGAIVANLGHLPGSASTITTRAESTVAAFAAAVDLLRLGGVLVAVIYTQHPGGRDESVAIERWAGELDPETWQVTWERSPEGAPRAPVILAARRRVVSPGG